MGLPVILTPQGDLDYARKCLLDYWTEMKAPAFSLTLHMANYDDLPGGDRGLLSSATCRAILTSGSPTYVVYIDKGLDAEMRKEVEGKDLQATAVWLRRLGSGQAQRLVPGMEAMLDLILPPRPLDRPNPAVAPRPSSTPLPAAEFDPGSLKPNDVVVFFNPATKEQRDADVLDPVAFAKSVASMEATGFLVQTHSRPGRGVLYRATLPEEGENDG